MGFMDKFMNAMRLNADDEEYYDDYYDKEDEYMDDEPIRPRRSAFRRNENREDDMERPSVSHSDTPKASASSKITPMRSSRRANQSVAMEVCVIKPKTVDDAREIAETLLAGRTIVLNLEGIDLEVGQRLIDFTSGSCFAIGGNLQKISNYIFIVTPQAVDISGDIQSIVDAFDVSSIQMDI